MKLNLHFLSPRVYCAVWDIEGVLVNLEFPLTSSVPGTMHLLEHILVDRLEKDLPLGSCEIGAFTYSQGISMYMRLPDIKQIFELNKLIEMRVTKKELLYSTPLVLAEIETRVNDDTTIALLGTPDTVQNVSLETLNSMLYDANANRIAIHLVNKSLFSDLLYSYGNQHSDFFSSHKKIDREKSKRSCEAFFISLISNTFHPNDFSLYNRFKILEQSIFVSLHYRMLDPEFALFIYKYCAELGLTNEEVTECLHQAVSMWIQSKLSS